MSPEEIRKDVFRPEESDAAYAARRMAELGVIPKNATLWQECFLSFNCLSMEQTSKIKNGIAREFNDRHPGEGLGSSDMNHIIFGAWQSAQKDWDAVMQCYE